MGKSEDSLNIYRQGAGGGPGGALTTKTWPTPYSFFQPFFSVSTQISPDFEIFGWKIFVTIVPAFRLWL